MESHLRAADQTEILERGLGELPRNAKPPLFGLDIDAPQISEPTLPGSREIQDFVKVQLAAHEYPRFVAFVETLPMTATGKVLRRELRALG